jgi:superfamily II DNA or RNA helicase
MKNLYDFQNDAVANILKFAARKKTHEWTLPRGGAIEMPTGAGKTTTFSYLSSCSALATILGAPVKMIVLAHTDELAHQAKAEIEEMANESGGLAVALEKADQKASPTADVIVSSPQTLAHNKSISRHHRHNNWKNINLIVIDEAHHALETSQYKTVLDILDPNLDKVILGFSATFRRTNVKEDLSWLFGDDFVYRVTIRELIDRGRLVRPLCYAEHTNTDLTDVPTGENGEFIRENLATAIDTPARNRVVLHGYQGYGKNKKAIGFTESIPHAKNLAKLFNEAGIPADHISGEDSSDVRKGKIAKHKSGKTKVLFNCALLREGYNDQSVEVILMASPTCSEVVYVQKAGRGLRTFTYSDGSKKTHCIVIDFYDEDRQHALITLPRLAGVTARHFIPEQGTEFTALQDEVKCLPEPADGEEMSVDAKGDLCWTESDLLRDGHGLHPMAGESPNDYTAVGKDAMVLELKIQPPSAARLNSKEWAVKKWARAHKHVRCKQGFIFCQRSNGVWSAVYCQETHGSYRVLPVFTRDISDPCSGRLLFRTRKEVITSTDGFLQRLRSQLTKEENEVLDTTVLADAANKKTNWKKLRGTNRSFLIDKFREITSHDPADDMSAGDLSAIIAEDKFGQHYFGRDFDGPAQRAPQPVSETKPPILDPNTTDILTSGSENYQGFEVTSYSPIPDSVAA